MLKQYEPYTYAIAANFFLFSMFLCQKVANYAINPSTICIRSFSLIIINTIVMKNRN